MEEKSKKDLSIWIILLIGILVISLGCCIIYIMNSKTTIKQTEYITTTQPNAKTVLGNDTEQKVEKNEINSLSKAMLEEYISKFYYIKNFDSITKKNIDEIMTYAILEEPSMGLTWDGERLGINSKKVIKDLVAENFKCSVKSLPDSNDIRQGDNYDFLDRIKQWPFEDGDVDQFITYYTQVTDVKKVSDNKYEVTALQIASILSRGVDQKESKLFIAMSSDGKTKEIKSKISKVDASSYKENDGKKCIEEVKKYAEENKLGYRIFTIEIDNGNSRSDYTGMNKLNFKLVSIK